MHKNNTAAEIVLTSIAIITRFIAAVRITTIIITVNGQIPA